MNHKWPIVPLALILLSLVPTGLSEDLGPTAVLDFGSFIADLVIDEGRAVAYLSARDLDAVLVVALADLTLTASIPVGDAPMRMDVDPGMERLYVGLSGGQGVTVVRLDTREVQTTWTVGRAVEEVVVGTRGRIYVSGEGISALDSTDGSTVWWRNALESVLLVSPDGRYLYSGGLYTLPATVEKWDVQTDAPTVAANNRDTNGLSDMALSPDGTRLYLAARYQTQGGCAVAVLDTSTMAVVDYIPDCEPLAVAASPDGSRVLAGYSFIAGYNSATRERVDSYSGPLGYLRAIRVNADRSLILASQTDYNPSVNRVIVFRADRTAPVANAGVDRTVEQGAVVTLDGSGSTDNVAVDSFTWSFTDIRPVVLHGERPAYRFRNVGVIDIALTVQDPSGNTASDAVVITVTAPPIPWIPFSAVLAAAMLAAVGVRLFLRRTSTRRA